MKTCKYLIGFSLIIFARIAIAQNYFAGEGAGANNTTGNRNTFVGSYAGHQNDSGDSNTYVGSASGYRNTIGTANTFIGGFAGVMNTTGSYNTFLGEQAGFYSTQSSFNTFLGQKAGYVNSGNDNSFVGHQAGVANTTGQGNTFLGKNAGMANNTGSQNVFIGHESGRQNWMGRYNVFVGQNSGFGNQSGSGNLMLGYSASMPVWRHNLFNATAIGFLASVSTSNAMVLGSTKGVNGAWTNTNVGISTHSPAYRLHVNASDAAKVGGGSWVVASDRRLKKDVSDYQEGLESLLKIHPVWFRYNGKAGIQEEKRFVGVLAQEIQKVAPYMVGEFTYQDTLGNEERYLDFDANALTYMLINAVKEQQAQLVARDQQVEQLRQEVAALRELVLKGQSRETPVPNSQLFQNEPNPIQSSSVIRYRVPETARAVKMTFYSSTGQEVWSQDLRASQQGTLTVQHKQFAKGVYTYSLFVDGRLVESKKLLID